ncbi:hypothetical protein SUGI_0496500 [Cryptomeria japonica]|nr:hypothetical protein SUGI_0496500 [Cryptomeria japonica]
MSYVVVDEIMLVVVVVRVVGVFVVVVRLAIVAFDVFEVGRKMKLKGVSWTVSSLAIVVYVNLKQHIAHLGKGQLIENSKILQMEL